MKKVITLAVGMVLAFNVNAWSLFGSYDDCILENVKSGMNKFAVGAVKKACRNKYPLPKAKSFNRVSKCRNIPLSLKELANIKLSVENTGYSLMNYNNFSVKNVEISYQIKGNKQVFSDRMVVDFDDKYSFLDVLEFRKLKKYLIKGLAKNITKYTMVKGSKKICG